MTRSSRLSGHDVSPSGRGRAGPSLLLALAVTMVACGDGGTAADRSAHPPRTEAREDCAQFDALRQPFFGDLHVHTGFSADARIFGTQTTPRDAYAFARGGEIALADVDEQPTRRARIDRPLDFTAVTDHSEFLGEVALCSDPSSSAYQSETCRLLRQAEEPGTRFEVTVHWLFPAGIPDPPPSLPFCEELGLDCDAAAASAWRATQEAAEEAYDRSSACSFTSFVGYEHTASPIGKHLHRNVIFRNENVPALPASQLETEPGGTPQGLWSAIEKDCLDAGFGCEAILIPHNSNLSGGQQWLDPADGDEARRRRAREPLVEIFQHKAGSECRFDRLAGLGADTEDELCTFEQRPGASETPGEPAPTIEEYPRRNMVRNALKDGLLLEESLGANPFELGIIASTDGHDATSGNVAEGGWYGFQGNEDASPGRLVSRKLRNNPGGLAVVWAEENSRDAIFAALARRETYGTSGTRPLVRFFAGDLDGLTCSAPDFVARAYATGTPMGGRIGPFAGGARPRFAVLAAKDPGSSEAPGTDLERLQIVKGWLDAGGRTHERVFDVARAGDAVASVDPGTCAPPAGAAELCAVWEDPDFDPGERAFYYVRVLERPTCRWSTLVCRSAGVDPLSAGCPEQAATAGVEFENCCRDPATDPFYEPVIRERAWTSPIWVDVER